MENATPDIQAPSLTDNGSQQVPTPPTSHFQTNPKPDKPFAGKVIVVLIAVLILIGIIVGLKYFYQPKQQKTTIPATTPIPAPTGYKTYQNKDQKFSVSYPSDLQLKETSPGFGVSTIELRSQDNSDPAYAPDIQMLTLPKTLAKAIGQDFDSFYEMAENTTKTITSPLDGNSSQVITKIRNRDVQGMRAVEYTSLPSPNPDKQQAEVGVFVEKGNDMLIVAGSENNRDQLEEMIKTITSQ